jgi:hypothetical protein
VQLSDLCVFTEPQRVRAACAAIGRTDLPRMSAGAERIYLQVLDLDDLEHLDVIAAAVITER